MESLDLILPEIFISISIMFLLIVGVFKKNSSTLIYNLSTISLVILLASVYNLSTYSETLLFATIFTGGIFTVPIGFAAGKGYLDGTNGFGHLKAVLVGLLPALILNVIILTIYIF